MMNADWYDEEDDGGCDVYNDTGDAGDNDVDNVAGSNDDRAVSIH